MMLLLGRIAGISGILAGIVDIGGIGGIASGQRGWRISFAAGIPLGAYLFQRFSGGTPFEITSSTPLLVVAGLMVGIGTRLGGGCTSGHGICGLARGSRRSLAATGTFMVTAAITVWVVRHLLGGGPS